MIDKILNIFIFLIGLCFAIRFRSIGKIAIEQRRRFNKLLPFASPENNFGKTAIIITQVMFLFIGMLFILVGLARLFQ